MEVLLAAITAALMGYQTTASEFRNNSLYTFNIDPATSDIVVMNTQTGHLYRCNRSFECDGGLDLKPKSKSEK
jgi:hypothetical protein